MAKKKHSSLGAAFAFIGEQSIDNEAPTKVPLGDIRPDPEQPRQLLPHKFRVRLLNDSPLEIIQDWRNADFATENFQELCRLADSIAQHGLINPITVRKDSSGQSKYLIVTGERRWWAHVLLASEARQIQEGSKLVSVDEIRINLTADGSSIRAHQLIENLERNNLNIIEKARGILALRDEMSSHPTRGSGDVPWREVEKALGMGERQRQRIIKALSLCDDAIVLIQDHHLSERVIRPVVTKLRDDPRLQVEALQRIANYNEEEQVVTFLKYAEQVVDDLLSDDLLSDDLLSDDLLSDDLLSDDEVSFEDVAKVIIEEGLETNGKPWFVNAPEEFFNYAAKKLKVTPEIVGMVWAQLQFGAAPHIYNPTPEEPDDDIEEEPAYTPAPKPTHKPESSYQPAHQPEPTHQPKPTHQPEPTHQPKPTHQPEPTHQPKPTHQPEPAHQPKPTHQPKPGDEGWHAPSEPDTEKTEPFFSIEIEVKRGKRGKPFIKQQVDIRVTPNHDLNLSCEYWQLRHELKKLLNHLEKREE